MRADDLFTPFTLLYDDAGDNLFDGGTGAGDSGGSGTCASDGRGDVKDDGTNHRVLNEGGFVNLDGVVLSFISSLFNLSLLYPQYTSDSSMTSR